MKQSSVPPHSILIVAALAFAKAGWHKLRHGDDAQHPSSSRNSKNENPARHLRQMTQEEMQPLAEHLTRIGSQCIAEGLDTSELSSWHITHPFARWWSVLTRTLLPAGPNPVPLTASASITLVCKIGIELVAIVFVAVSESAASYRILLLILLAVLLLMDAATLTLGARAAAAEIVEPAQLPETQKSLSGEATAAANKLLHGTWHKVDDLSDSQEDAARMLKLGGVARTAMKMFKGMEIILEGTEITTMALTKVPFLRVAKETYALNGTVSCYPRRDMRKGNFVGYVKVQANGDINLYYRFEEPLAGHCCDEIKLLSENELHIVTHLTVGTESCTYRVVYNRAGSKAPTSPAASSSLNGFCVELKPASEAADGGSGGSGESLSRQSNQHGLFKAEESASSGACSDDSKHSDGRDDSGRSSLDQKQLPPAGSGQPPLPPHMRRAHRKSPRRSLDDNGKWEAHSADTRLGRNSLDERKSHFSPARRSGGLDERRCSSPFARVCGVEL